MNPLFSFSVRSGLLALGLMAGLSAPAFAGPIAKPVLPMPANAVAPEIVPVRESWAGGNDRRSESGAIGTAPGSGAVAMIGDGAVATKPGDGVTTTTGAGATVVITAVTSTIPRSISAWVSGCPPTTIIAGRAIMSRATTRLGVSIARSDFPAPMSAGATTAIGPIALGTTRSSPMAVRASSAGRPIAEWTQMNSNGAARSRRRFSPTFF